MNCSSVYYYHYLFCSCSVSSLHWDSVCLICNWPPEMEFKHALENPVDLKLLFHGKIHLCFCNSESALQVFLIVICAVGGNCPTTTLCQQNQSTCPGPCPSLPVEITRPSTIQCSYILRVALQTSQLFQFWHQIQKSFLTLSSTNWIFIPTASW